MKPGVHDGLTIEAYHASPGISKTGLARYADNPARFRWGEHPQTRSMAFGSLIHTAVLEPDQLDHRYQASQLRAFNENHRAYQAEQAQALGRELVKQADLDDARRIADAVHAHPVASALLTPHLIVERSFAWNDPATSTLCRGRADAIEPNMRVMVDLKSTEDAGPDAFARACLNYRYHWQVPMYSDGMLEADGWMPDAFIFLAVEKARPHLVGCYELDKRSILLGRRDIAHWLPRYARSLASEEWRGHAQHIQTISLPHFAFPRT